MRDAITTPTSTISSKVKIAVIEAYRAEYAEFKKSSNFHWSSLSTFRCRNDKD